MKKIILFLIGILFFIGCSTSTIITNGIPNLKIVDKSLIIYRGGQPPNKNGFKYLKSIGITNIVKLNLEDNEDVDAKALGINVVYIPITWEEQLFHMPKEKFEKAVGSIIPGTFVHCEFGHDRTGLIIAGYRMKTGWTKDKSKKEMLDDGFHTELFGLW